MCRQPDPLPCSLVRQGQVEFRGSTFTPPCYPLCAVVDGRRRGSRKKNAEERKVAKQLANRRQYEKKLRENPTVKKERLPAQQQVKAEAQMAI